MVIYVDMLVILNFLVDFFLLSATARILKRRTPLIRRIIAALVGGLSSLYIFIEGSNAFFDFSVRFGTAALLCAVAFGIKPIKSFFKAWLVNLVVTLTYGAAMTLIFKIFSPNGMYVRNSVVYFDVSPIELIVFTVISYFAISLLSYFFSATATYSKKCDVTVEMDGKKTTFTAICDTGNSIKDLFSNSEIIVADTAVFVSLVGTVVTKLSALYPNRYNLVPIKTVSGNDMLEALRCDKAIIESEKGRITLEKPLLALSKTKLHDGYSGILNPEIFE